MAEGEVQRRLAAIVSADVAGYSRLMGEDEAGTLATMKAHRRELWTPITEKYGGRVVGTAGDSLLIEFASAVAAVESSVAVQRGMAEGNADLPEPRRMLVRIGINIGEVIVDGDDIFGDGVNVAARLQELAEPGGVMISANVHEQVEGKHDERFEDAGTHEVKNIARPISVWRWAPSAAASVYAAIGSPELLPLPDKPSIAVLPFDNMSGDPEQEYFADGITEDIITELSRFRGFFVIARNSSFAFRGQSIDIAEVGRRLGVQFVVEGSVRKAGNRIRVSAQLIDASSGHHLWAERYDRELEDIFAVQDEITQAIVSVVPDRAEDAARERTERSRTLNWTAYDFVLVGIERWRRFTREGVAEARGMFEKALELDPQYARAHANLAWTHVNEMFLELSNAESPDKALKHAGKALALDDDDAWSHGVMAQTLFLAGQDEEAQIHFRRALALNPNDADIAAVFANILVYWARVDEALEWIAVAKRLNPFCPSQYHWYQALAFYSAREYEQAVTAIKEIRSLDRWYRGLLAACYGQMGRISDARTEAELFVKARQRELEERGEPLPRATLDLALVRADRYRNPSDREHFLDGLRKAGLLEK